MFESKHAAFDIAYPSNTRLILSAEEIKLYRDFEGAIRVIGQFCYVSISQSP